MNVLKGHSFHIPVLGLGYSIDSPINVAPYGISSVISLVDDSLIESMREFYCKKFDLPFQEISKKVEDFRAKRITSYLNVVEEIVNKKVCSLKESAGSELEKYSDMLPDASELKAKLSLGEKGRQAAEDLSKWIQEKLPVGYEKSVLLIRS